MDPAGSIVVTHLTRPGTLHVATQCAQEYFYHKLAKNAYWSLPDRSAIRVHRKRADPATKNPGSSTG